MASLIMAGLRLYVMTLLIFLCVGCKGKLMENKTNSAETKGPRMDRSSGSILIFADELKQTLERYIFGICPQTYKFRWSQMPLSSKIKNGTALSCDLDSDQQDLAGRLAGLALRAHTASRSDCARLGIALANTLGDLARTAAERQALATAAANEANKKRKLSKSQKAKIQAKQRTALAVKKKAAAAAAAAAAKIAT